MRDHLITRALSGNAKPPQKSRNRTLINLSLTLHSIDFDIASKVFKVDGLMVTYHLNEPDCNTSYLARFKFLKVLTWNDPRYAWNPSDYSEVTYIPLPFSKSWAPEVILHNAAEEKFIYRHRGTVKFNGDLGYLVAIHAKSQCKPNFDDDGRSSFPFNIQTCSLKFGSWVNEDYRVEYRVPDPASAGQNHTAVNMEDFNSPGGWEILATEAKLESVHYPTFDEPSNLVVFTFAFKRRIFFDPMTNLVYRVKIDSMYVIRVIKKSLMQEEEETLRGDQNEL